MSIGNVTMVSVVVENSQIRKAVDLQRRMSCEMQLNVVLNVQYMLQYSCTFRRNKNRISLSEHPVCVLYTDDIQVSEKD